MLRERIFRFMQASGKTWSVDELAHALWLDAPHVRRVLARLQADGKVVVSSVQQFDHPSEVRYQAAAPAWPLPARKSRRGAARSRWRFSRSGRS